MSHPHPRPGTKGEPRGYSSRPTSLCVLGCWSPSSPSCRSSQPLLAHPTVMESSLPFTRMHRLTHQCPPWTTAILPVSSSPSPREDSCPLSSSLPLSHSSICGRASWAGGHCLHSYAGGFCVDPHQHVLCLPCAVALRRSSGPSPPPQMDGLTQHVVKSPPTVSRVCGEGRVSEPTLTQVLAFLRRIGKPDQVLTTPAASGREFGQP